MRSRRRSCYAPSARPCPRFGSSEPLDTGAMHVRRRISATYKDMPGGQVLGATTDYTHRLFDWTLLGEGGPPNARPAAEPLADRMPRVPDILDREGLLEPERAPAGDPRPADVTRDAIEFPAERDVRLQTLARGDEGVPARPRLLGPTRVRRQSPLRWRDPHRRGDGGVHAGGAGFHRRCRRPHRDRVPDGEPVQRLERISCPEK